jgi:hypothetical protein
MILMARVEGGGSGSRNRGRKYASVVKLNDTTARSGVAILLFYVLHFLLLCGMVHNKRNGMARRFILLFCLGLGGKA